MSTILDRQKYHGAALIQVAEHEEFTSINRIPLPGTRAHSAFSVNEEIGIFLKYATAPSNTERAEYKFGFTKENLDDIEVLEEDLGDAYAVLIICDDVRDNKEICCVPYSMLSRLKGYRDRRNENLGRSEEDGVDVYVQIRYAQPFEVNVKSPGRPGYAWRENIPKGSFPDIIFG